MGRPTLNRKLCVAATAGLLLLPACVRAFEATIANPCDTDVAIESYGVPANDLPEADPIARFRLPAEDITTVDRVFLDAAGTRWTLLVVDTDFKIELTREQAQSETILIPASACP